METSHVKGKDFGQVMLFALSTCVWCKKTKGLLQEMNVGFDYAYIDLLSEADKNEAMEIIKQWNPRCSFPSLIVNESKCIVGFDEQKIRELLK